MILLLSLTYLLWTSDFLGHIAFFIILSGMPYSNPNHISTVQAFVYDMFTHIRLAKRTWSNSTSKGGKDTFHGGREKGVNFGKQKPNQTRLGAFRVVWP